MVSCLHKYNVQGYPRSLILVQATSRMRLSIVGV